MGVRGDHGEPVAIIGMSCRFPGAGDPAEFHDLTTAGRRMFEPTAGLGQRALHAALLDDWTPPFSGLEGDGSGLAGDLGPVQKLATETAALALADAGLREAAGTSRTGIILASTSPGVCDQVRGQFGVAPGGPYPDAAYQSSLHAIGAAASALQAGLVDLAVAGGIELGVNLDWLARQDRAGTLGTDEMRVYAADPSGLLPGEGCGMVVLVRAADARAAGVPVYAEIAGWSTVPAVAGADPALAQAGLLRAYQRAGIDPADIQLLEGAGTGTAAGDAAELDALAQLRNGSQGTAALGAVSACIGYTRAAAGVASLIKVAVAMAAGTVPPGPGCVRPYPVIGLGQARLRMPEHAEPWPDGNAGTLGNQGPRLAAVNSLGTADPADLAGWQTSGPGFAGPRGAEGVHLVLRREGEADRSGRRRRRAAADTIATAPPGRHSTAVRPPAASTDTPPSADLGQRPQAGTDRGRVRGPETDAGHRPMTEPGYRPMTETGYQPMAHPGHEPAAETGYRPMADPGHQPAAETELARPDAAPVRPNVASPRFFGAPPQADGALPVANGTLPQAVTASAGANGAPPPPDVSAPQGDMTASRSDGPQPQADGAQPQADGAQPLASAAAPQSAAGPQGDEGFSQADEALPPAGVSGPLDNTAAPQGDTAAPQVYGLLPEADAEAARADAAQAVRAQPVPLRDLLPRVLAALSRLPVDPQAAPLPQEPTAPPPDAQDELPLPRRVPGGALSVQTEERPGVFALCGDEPGALASRLDVIAGSANMLSATGLGDLARQLAVGAAAQHGQLADAGAAETGHGPTSMRVALTAGTPSQLAAQARQAAQMLRASGRAAAADGPGIRISAGAGGAIVVVFPGRADSAAGQSMQLVASLESLDMLDALGIHPVAAVGYGLGEITGLAWAGCVPETEAARLMAQCSQALRACTHGPGAIARVTADAETAQALCAPGVSDSPGQLHSGSGQLHICAYETPCTQVLTGSVAGIREMARRAEALGIGVEMLTATAPLHSPTMARCSAPLRGVFAGTVFAAPRRRLVSTVTGRQLMPHDDIAQLLTRQVSLPVLFSQAMSVAAEGADLIVTAAPADAGLTGRAAGCGVPAVSIPASTRPGRLDAPLAQALAALFTAGAVTDLMPFLAPARAPGSAIPDTLASKTVPRMRDAEPEASRTPGHGGGTDGRTAARPAQLPGQGAGLLPVRPQRHPGGTVGG